MRSSINLQSLFKIQQVNNRQQQRQFRVIIAYKSISILIISQYNKYKQNKQQARLKMQPQTTNNYQSMNFVQMANQIHNIQVHKQFSQCLNNFEAIQHIFTVQIQKSQTLLFVACQTLSKKLVSNQLQLNNDDFDALTSLVITEKPGSATLLENKKNILFNVAAKLYNIVNKTTGNKSVPDYIVRSCINTISLCINSTVGSSAVFQPFFNKYLNLIAPDFIPNQMFIKPVSDGQPVIIQASADGLGFHHQYVIQILNSLLDYVVNSTYFVNYYYFRRNLYSFRNNYLAYVLNYSLFCLKSVFKATLSNPSIQNIYLSIRPALKLFQNIVTYPFSLNMHQFQIQDQIHENISGLQSQIYFPSFFRNLLCDTGILMDLIGYYSRINNQASTIEPVRDDIYLLIRIIGRVMSTSQYIFVGEQEKKAFRSLSVNFITSILKQMKFYDTYLILCLSKINIKFMSVQNQDQLFQGKKQYFAALNKFICEGLAKCDGKIQDGDKHPFRQIFQTLTAFVNITANTILDEVSKNCAQQALNILLKNRLVDNVNNQKLMKQFGANNNQQIDCFKQIFARVPQIFKINLPVNLTTLHELNLSVLNSSSLTFWLHLSALLLPEHDTSVEQTQLIIKFLEAAIQARSIASLQYIQTLVSQILYQVKDGVSTTYLWKFIQQQKNIKFDQFLSYIIEYAMKILTVPNYTLIQNCLQLFKVMFTRLCRFRHKSFSKYFEIIEQVCKEIDKTMLVHPDYIKLRIGFFSIISIIWINQGQVSFVYRIFNNIRQSLGQHNDFVHFLRYMTDITGLLQPVQSSEVYKILLELVLIDMQSILPFYFGTPQKLAAAFGQEVFLKTFVKFVLTIVTDHGYRLTFDVHTELPFQIQQTFKPYLIQVLKYDYPQKTVQLWLKFLKLNPLGKLLPLDKSLKQQNSSHYKSLLRQYFQNLHRLQNLQQFYYMYSFIDDNIELMSDWWQEIMIRGFKPDVNVNLVVSCHIWANSRQKETFAKLLFRIAMYDPKYWRLECEANTQARYAEWFVKNYN